VDRTRHGSVIEAVKGYETPHDLLDPPTDLVVDDEPAIRDLLSSLLADGGYAVRQAADGVDALRSWSTMPLM
jgi:hypothetical protein